MTYTSRPISHKGRPILHIPHHVVGPPLYHDLQFNRLHDAFFRRAEAAFAGRVHHIHASSLLDIHHVRGRRDVLRRHKGLHLAAPLPLEGRRGLVGLRRVHDFGDQLGKVELDVELPQEDKWIKLKVTVVT